MTRILKILGVQAQPLGIGAPFASFAQGVRTLAGDAPTPDIIVFPELHLFHPGAASPGEQNQALREAAQPLDGPLHQDLAALAAEVGVWLVPGSLCERGPAGELFNTAPVYSPQGERVAFYRKVFPWRPTEPYDPGDRFVTFDIPGKGRIGLSICYDAWFPEATRQLAWQGAELILNLVKTTTPDREHELVLARANAIVNQLFLLSVNCAGPVGMGRSVMIGPEGEVRREAPDAAAAFIYDEIDLDQVRRVRETGTCGSNRMWSQFSAADRPVWLPSYEGWIKPQRWSPPAFPFEK